MKTHDVTRDKYGMYGHLQDGPGPERMGAEKLFSVPSLAFTLDTGHKHPTLDVPRDMPKSAPDFERDHWPAMADKAWAAAAHKFSGTSAGPG